MAKKENVAWIFQLISNAKSLSDLVVITKRSRLICSNIQGEMKYSVDDVLSVFK